MNIDVYDTCAQSESGHVIHFDVFVEQGTSAETAFGYAEFFLKEMGEDENALEQHRCNFCHTELANPIVHNTVREKGYYILQMAGCPNPVG